MNSQNRNTLSIHYPTEYSNETNGGNLKEEMERFSALQSDIAQDVYRGNWNENIPSEQKGIRGMYFDYFKAQLEAVENSFLRGGIVFDKANNEYKIPSQIDEASAAEIEKILIQYNRRSPGKIENRITGEWYNSVWVPKLEGTYSEEASEIAPPKESAIRAPMGPIYRRN